MTKRTSADTITPPATNIPSNGSRMATTCQPQTFTSNAHLVCYRRAFFGIARLKVMHQNNRILARQGQRQCIFQKTSLTTAINILALKAAAA